jgi:hypothetical protein
VTFLEAFLEGTEPAKPCSAVEHFRISLPYYLQRFDVTDNLELSIDGDALVKLVGEGQGDCELQPGGKELLVHVDGQDLQVRLDIDRAGRKAAENTLQQAGAGTAVDPKPGASPAAAGTPPTHFGVDGRPAVVVPIHYD